MNISRPERGILRSLLGGACLVLIGNALTAFVRIMAAAYPQNWGGPNIGGGGVILLGYILIVCGVAWWFIEWMDRRHRRQEKKSPFGSS